MQGSLTDMSVADLIQHNCQDQKTAQAIIQHNGQQAALFFKNGAVIHAELGDITGEEVVYQLLSWDEGRFELKSGQETAAQTITRSWSGLLLEGARRLDEATVSNESQNSQELSFIQEEKPMAKKKSET